MDKNIDGGCVLIARKILFSDIWKKPSDYLKIWFYILTKVNHKNKLFERGSNFFNWAEEINNFSGISKNTIVNCIKWLKSTEQITTEKTTRGMVIKVNNYETYQNLDNYRVQHEIQHEVQNEYSSDTEQVQYEYSTINNNVRMKECKKSNGGKKFTPPTPEEIKRYCTERNNCVDAQRFFDYYNAGKWKDSSGKPIKNWKQKMIAAWENKNSKNENSDAFYMSLSR